MRNPFHWKREEWPLPQRALFTEQFRQLRMGGIAYVFVCASVALFGSLQNMPAVEAQYHYGLTAGVSGWLNSLLTVWLALSAVFLTGALYYVTCFLRSVKVRDFYGAAPFTQGRVWASGAAAVLAWHGLAMVASCGVCLLCMMPFDAKAAGGCLLALAGLLATTMLLFGMILLAFTLTGKAASAFLTLAGLAALSPALHLLYYVSGRYFEKNDLFVPYPRVHDMLTYFAGETELLDFMSLNPSMTGVYAMLTSGRVMGWSLTAGLLMAVLAAYAAVVRTGDAVGRAFISRPVHAAVMTVAAIPVAALPVLLGVLELAETSGGALRTGTIWILLVLGAAGTAGLFWLAERMLASPVRTAFCRMPLALVSLAVCAAVAGVGAAVTRSDMTAMPAADEAASFTLCGSSKPARLGVFRFGYGSAVTSHYAFTDRSALEMLLALHNDAAGRIRRHGVTYQDGSNEKEDTVCRVEVKLRLKNGRELPCGLCLNRSQTEALESAMLDDKTFTDAFFALPEPEKVNIDLSAAGLSGEEAVGIYRVFREEFAAWTAEQKLGYLRELFVRFTDYEPDESFPEEDAAEQTGGEAPTVIETVSDSDVPSLQVAVRNASLLPGDFALLSLDCREADASVSAAGLEMNLNGYLDGHLYDEAYAFGACLILPLDRMPETARAVVTCLNGKMENTEERLREIRSQAAAEPGENIGVDPDGTEINVTCCGDGQAVGFRYLLLDSPEQWDDVPPENMQGTTVVTYETDANAETERLFADIRATGTVDFSLPYTVVTISGADFSELTEDWDIRNMVFFCQTDEKTRQQLKAWKDTLENS